MSTQVSSTADMTTDMTVDSEAASFASNITDAGCDDVITFAASLRTQADSMITAPSTIVQHNNTMKGRAITTVTVSRDLFEDLCAAMDRLSASLKQIARAREAGSQQTLSKAADDFEAMATLMDAGAAMSKGMRANIMIVQTSLVSLDNLARNLDNTSGSVRLCVPVSTLSPSELASMSTVWRELPNGVASTVSGSGTKHFIKGAAGVTRNVVLVYPRVASGALAEYVKPDDVRLILKDDAGSLIDAHVTVKHVSDGGLQLAYAVAADCVSKLSVGVTACGVAIGPAVTVRQGYDAANGTNHVISHDVGARFMSGMAVNTDGSLMAVSHGNPVHQVYVFRLTPAFERVNVIGRKGSGPAEFQYPSRLCFTDDDTILVCDSGSPNSRVQRLTVDGEYISSFGVVMPFSIAVHGDVVAVGTGNSPIPIEIHCLASGDLIRCFGSNGDGPGQIGHYATGIRFTPDGAGLLVAEFRNRRLSIFTVDGVFIKHIVANMLASTGCRNDVSYGASGEIIVADNKNCRIYVFSPDGDTLIKTWGSEGSAVGQFYNPKVMAVSGPYLYVMDDTHRVQVFE